MRIIATVTNDLTTDQRMHRICTTLVEAGHQVRLVGRVRPNSTPLQEAPYSMTRLRCWFEQGPLFYAEYNLRLFFFLLINPFDAVNSVDLDTLTAGCMAARLSGKKCVFDAHEHFAEVPEVTNRKLVKSIWHNIGRLFIPLCSAAYTVGPKLAELLSEAYQNEFKVVRNVPQSRPNLSHDGRYLPFTDKPFLFYQGALNVGRGLEQTIEAMHQIDGLQLLLAGDGDLTEKLKTQVKAANLADKVQFLGVLNPETLKGYTERAWLGLNLLEPIGLSYRYSLANKFFDYIAFSVPGLSVAFPEYEAIVAHRKVAVLLPDIMPETISSTIRNLQNNEAEYQAMQAACVEATKQFCWEKEQAHLLGIWERVFANKQVF
jgi:glycosyltransferase involved in cell wall biosynthesis